MEMKLKNIPRNNNIDLTADGVLKGAEEWCYNKDVRQILNGSASAPNVPATKIRFGIVVKIVTERLAQTYQGNLKENMHEAVQ